MSERYPWIIREGERMSVEFAEGLLKRIEAGQPDLGWKAEQLRVAIDLARLTKCPCCGKMKSDVHTGSDPYAAEINNSEIEMTACGDCFRESAEDI